MCELYGAALSLEGFIFILVRRPVPEWYVMVDSWLNIPYPDWYLEYVRVHFQAQLFPDAFMAAYANAAQSDDDHLEEVILNLLSLLHSVNAIYQNSTRTLEYWEQLPATAQHECCLLLQARPMHTCNSSSIE